MESADFLLIEALTDHPRGLKHLRAATFDRKYKARMSVLKVLRVGHPILRQVAKPLSREEILSPQTKSLVQNMLVTMKRVGGMGLAAPQIGSSSQIVVLDIPEIGENPRVVDKVLFNPMMEYLLKHEKIRMWESCLSVPGMTGKVERFNNVLIHYYDEEGIKRRIGASGYLAGIFQHELDHLRGELFLDKLLSPQSIYFDEEWQQFHAHEGDVAEDGSIKFFDK